MFTGVPNVSQATAFKKKDVLERIREIEGEISKGVEYLETGAHANWHGFHSMFTRKIRDGRNLPPHRDWVKNVFLRRRERLLKQAERALERVE